MWDQAQHLAYFRTSETRDVVPYHEWVHVWLRTHADRPNIKESLDDYIDEHGLLTPDLDEITETILRITVIKQSLEHVWPESRESLEEHLSLLEQMLELKEEKREALRELETWIREMETFDSDKSPSELDSVRTETHRIHDDLSAGKISSKQAQNQLDKLEEILNRVELEEMRKEAEKEDSSVIMDDESSDKAELLELLDEL